MNRLTSLASQLAPLPVLDFPLSDSGLCAAGAMELGFATFARIAEHVRRLPYGRVEADTDAISVLRRGKGTCSSKHRFLAVLARECGYPAVTLTLGLYAMSERNTPGVGPTLASAGLESIPECHCYLTWRGHRYDFTGLRLGPDSPFDTLIEERAVDPDELAAEKGRYHRGALADWARRIGIDADSAWQLRERCIERLSQRPGRGVANPESSA